MKLALKLLIDKTDLGFCPPSVIAYSAAVQTNLSLIIKMKILFVGVVSASVKLITDYIKIRFNENDFTVNINRSIF